MFGSPATESSFKAILGMGLLLARRQRLLEEGQPVIESTSGSLGVGLAQAGMLLGHKVHLVSDVGIPATTLKKLRHLQAEVHLAQDPHPVMGMQESRDRLLRTLVSSRGDYYWPDQNNSPLNPEVYRRWLVPRIQEQLGDAAIDAGCFVVGSGGHFTALAEMLRMRGTPSYAVDRIGSITFGGSPEHSVLRGVGNQNKVPLNVKRSMGLVRGVLTVGDHDAITACRELAKRGIFVGGSSGAAYRASLMLLSRLGGDSTVLTFFPDRGELYSNIL